MKSIENIYKYAFLVALSGWFLNFIAYSAGVQVMTKAGLFIATFMGALTIYFVLRLREQNGGCFTYYQALKVIFTFGILYGVGEAICSFLLYRFLDPELFTKMQEMLVWRMQDSLEKVQNAQQAEMIEEFIGILKKTNFNYEFWMVGLDILYKFVKYTFYAFILAIGLKKKNPNPLA